MSDQDDATRRGAATPAWTRERATRVGRDAGTVAPIIYPPDRPLDPSVHIWDTWLLRNRDGSIAEIDGWRVILSLTAPSDLLPGKRHDVATIRYFYSRDGRRWHSGGPVFSGGELGSRQWAGSVLHDDGDVYLYYTAAGESDEAHLSYTQYLAMADGGTVEADEEGLRIEGPWEHRAVLHPDGDRYETESQSRGMTYTFRDPWFYEDPETGRTYLVFEGNTPVPEGSEACGGDPAQQEFNGSVGLAESPTGDPTEWELREPLLDAVCVNQELERPHVVRRDGRYYLFVSSHRHTFAPGIDGVDGFYGFVADSLRGEYRPLNDSGLVVANPENAPFQAYSWLAFDHPDDLLVNSFFGYFDYDRPSLDEVAQLPESEQFRRFGGTLAPTLRIELDGDRSRIVGTLEHGHIPLGSEPLPDSPFDERAAEPSGYGREGGHPEPGGTDGF
ncbi:glycoside hydrolase family 68 protein [Salinirubellus sp. GCM10025818]|uniref:glycoside hydrolase family 68 protein n=1 Tax=Salinirubellus TaxID=2162630 RepID=UPI0030CC1502